MKFLALFGVVVWCALVIWRRDLRLPALMIALTLEISKTWFIFLPVDQSSPLSPVLLDLTRLTTGLVGLGFIYKWIRDRKNTSLLVFDGVIPFFLMTLVSLAITNQREVATVEVLRYVILFGLSISVADLFTENHRARQFVIIIAIIGGFLGTLGIVEYLIGQHYWANLEMLYYPRAQATFVDPNIYGRFLDLSLIWTLFWWQQERHKFAIPLGLLQLGGLIVSFSRGAWISFAVALLFWVIVNRDRLLIGISVGMGGLLAVISAVTPQIRQRFLSLFSGENVLGQRSWLLQAGVDMFRNHPLKGIGLGNFEQYFNEHYSDLLPSYGGVTRSHTTVVTIASEMGVFGLLALIYFLFAIVRTVRNLRRLGDAYILPIALSVLIIFISSQAEGRLFEDPWLWVFSGWIAQRSKYAHLWFS